MRLLLDHCVDRRLGASLSPREVLSTATLGWADYRNGHLLAAAARAGFDAMITTDRSIQYQQNVQTLPVAVVVLCARSNRLKDLLPLVPQVHEILKVLQPRQLVEVRGNTPPRNE